ncbi:MULTISPECIES: hypothetical protein [unclassified Oceanobacter]|jgi:hemoglobin|uniref:globin domain-containing protein n=1 Tax=unclassified Oceanobacter TaxID=2620260 RepID=UPI0026E31A37|nr:MULTISPECIES: hypothetical protein [unclassified Oceanobacter]MDO6681507.1 hypothetical protein [Oceanobacter sp. 5_MG-2023]MDP2506656.1 hypothetical protein [Oceanobacter sp. 3_MG-2023]MDP2548677.1 hypothetical protein [Oceanobacter sp. 4_MG-2023]MDP2609260.1 hypothetical protein [Oceanobacter sp. 1_MG-2023]MDP2612643.1 hypothetical protein [Oceanobacter sp. 2_MG-2023]
MSKRDIDELNRIPADAKQIDCFCSGSQLQAEPQERWMNRKETEAFPAVPLPSSALYNEVGAEALTGLVERHHQRLQLSVIGTLFPQQPHAFAATVAKSVAFILEGAGGPVDFTERHGEVRMRERHFPVSIDEAARDVWLLELLRSFDDVDFPSHWRDTYWRWMEAFSLRMVNRRTRMEPLSRYRLADAQASLLANLAAFGRLEQ